MADEHETRRSEAKAEEAISSAAREARAQSEALISEASERSRGLLEEQKTQTAAQFESIARALHHTAEQLSSDGQEMMSYYAGQTASSLEKWAGDLKRHDVSSLFNKMEHYAREQPAVFIGGAVAAGMLLSRFLKSAGSEAVEASHSESLTGDSEDKSREMYGYIDRAQAEYGELETRKPGSPKH